MNYYGVISFIIGGAAMVGSMTGFGRAKRQIDSLDITVEIKSVNHRFFEFTSRVPRGYMFLDEKLKKLCQEKISRGKVEVSVLIEDNSPDSTVVELNTAYADAYMKALDGLSKRYKLKNDVKVSSIVSNSDLFTVRRREADTEKIASAVTEVANEAIDSFIKMRAAEGERMADDVKNRLNTILKGVAFVEERSPQTVAAYRERLEARIRELIGDVKTDEQRLITETAVFADKIAVAEETVRLRSHITQFFDLLGGDEPVGRKLDFVVQEMNREANTIGSKSQDTDITRTVVDIKAEIEKIREQIQNIE